MNTSCQITKKYSENLMEHKFGRGYRRSIFTSMFFFNDDRLDRFLSSQGFLSLGLKFSFNLTWLKEPDHPRHETMYSNIISPLPPPFPSLPFWREFKNQGSHLIHLLISHRTHAIWTMKRTMAFRELSCLLFVCFFALGNAIYCLESSDCSALESCCPDNVCRERCYVCSYDYQCGSNEHCCKSKCISGLPSCSNVTLERNVVREYVRHTVVGAAELLQALPLEVLSPSPSSFPLYPASAVLLARTTVIVYPVLWSSPNSRNNSTS